MDINKVTKIHFIGIKGVGMTALACVAFQMGKKISGADVSDNFITQSALQKIRVQISIGFEAKDLPQDTELVIYSAGHNPSVNPQVIKAREKNIPTLSLAQG